MPYRMEAPFLAHRLFLVAGTCVAFVKLHAIRSSEANSLLHIPCHIVTRG